MAISVGRILLRGLKWLGIGLGTLVVVGATAGAIYEAHGRYRAHHDYQPVGALIDIGGRHIHLDCRGSGAPTVVFEAGLDTMGSLSWSAVHDAVAKTTRACAYDRAGIMWSDPAPSTTSIEAIAADLHAALTAAHETGPYVMVGHSLGGPYIMEFTKRYEGDVAGLVFVDASHPDQVQRFKQLLGKDLDGAVTPYKIAAALTPVGVPRLFWPKDDSPHVPARALEMSVAYGPMSLGAMLAEADAISHTFAEAGTFRKLGDRPVVVLSAMKPLEPKILAAVDITREQATRFQQAWLEMHNEEASWSSRSTHRQFTDSAHTFGNNKRSANLQPVYARTNRHVSGLYGFVQVN